MNSNPQGEDALPVLYNHCKDVYDAMLRHSSKQSFRDADGTTKEAVVYEGFLTKLVTDDLHLSVPYYTSTLRALKKMGCIRQLRRGGSTSPSQWQMYYEPNEPLFTNNILKATKKNTPAGQWREATEQQIRALNTRILNLEQALQKFLAEEENNGVHS